MSEYITRRTILGAFSVGGLSGLAGCSRLFDTEEEGEEDETDREEPDADTEVYTADAFEEGTFADGWASGTDRFDVVADDDATDGYAIYRKEPTGGLLASDESFDYTVEPGGRYLVITTKFSADLPYQIMLCGSAPDGDHDFPANRFEFAIQKHVDDIELRLIDDGSTTAVSEPHELPNDEYLQCVVHVDSDETARLWIYDGDGEIVADLSGDVGDYVNGTHWALNPNTNDDTVRTGVVEFWPNHPHDSDDSIAVEIPDFHDGEPTVSIDYDDSYDSSGQYNGLEDPYSIEQLRSQTDPTLTRSFDAASGTTTQEQTVDGAQKTCNSAYRFAEHGFDQYQEEVYSRIKYHPNGMTIGDTGSWRFYFAGISDGDRDSGGNGPPTGDDGWSINLVMSRRAQHNHPYGYDCGPYIYHMDQEGTNGDTWYTGENIWTDRWNTIECYQKLNTYQDGEANSDGVFKLWINGTLAFGKHDFRWITESGQGCEWLGANGYWYISDQNGQTTYWDEHTISLGDDIDDEIRE